MFEFLIIGFVLYIMYKVAVTIWKVLALIMLAIAYIVLYSTLAAVVIFKMSVKLYGKALRANTVMTIGLSCLAFTIYTVVSH